MLQLKPGQLLARVTKPPNTRVNYAHWMMMHQCWFINCNKNVPLQCGLLRVEEAVCVKGKESIWDFSLYSLPIFL